MSLSKEMTLTNDTKEGNRIEQSKTHKISSCSKENKIDKPQRVISYISNYHKL